MSGVHNSYAAIADGHFENSVLQVYLDSVEANKAFKNPVPDPAARI